MIHCYILNRDGEPEREPDETAWALWMEQSPDRILAHDTLDDGTVVSTIFLGLDHNHKPGGPPVLWETKIFYGTYDRYEQRYTSRDDALAGHGFALALAHRLDPT